MANRLLTQLALEGKEESALPFNPSDHSSLGPSTTNALSGQPSLQLDCFLESLFTLYPPRRLPVTDLSELGSFWSHSLCTRTLGQLCIMIASKEGEKKGEREEKRKEGRGKRGRELGWTDRQR